MHANHFDSLVRSLSVVRSRRRALAATIGAVLGTFGLTHTPDATAAKSGKCWRLPGECERCQRGKCERKHGRKTCKAGKIKPNASGTPCTGGSCQNGQCIAPDGSVVTPPADDPAGGPARGTTGGPPLSSCIPVCPGLQTCTSTSQCPPGTQCMGCATPVDLRCVPLCAS
jgi:hypothetical protein